jgi:hypothetical protein
MARNGRARIASRTILAGKLAVVKGIAGMGAYRFTLLVFATAYPSECLLMNRTQTSTLPQPARLAMYWR